VSAPTIHAARFEELSARTFHDIVRLRLDTFIVEQDCPYHELDGRDILPTTEHVWMEEDGEVVSYLRLYPGDEGATWLGRVVTAPSHRQRGLGALLMAHALRSAPRPVRISAQSRLAAWYAGFGFERCGPDFIEDGIPHTPMGLDR
jgi:ElaA protein